MNTLEPREVRQLAEGHEGEPGFKPKYSDSGGHIFNHHSLLPPYDYTRSQAAMAAALLQSASLPCRFWIAKLPQSLEPIA